ncbi:MAG: hypothetical protein KC912_04230 [Proteobacteria bacterium]|nr:hypothetical protein [Pseudomonadota bacterium]
MRPVLLLLALAFAAPAAATDVIVLLTDGETLEGDLVKHKYGKFYWVQQPGGKTLKLKWNAVADIRSNEPGVELDLGGPSEEPAGPGLPEDAKKSKAPMKDVEAAAVRHEAKLVKKLEGYTRDPSYWMARSDAGAIAAAALPPEVAIVEADYEHLATDYVWATEDGIEENVGEWHEQRRERVIVEVSPGPFVSIAPFRETSVRRYYGGKGEPIWKTEREELELTVQQQLDDIEQDTLDGTAVILAPSEAKRLIKPFLPEGFTLETTADSVIATGRWSEARGNPKNGEWARWERVHTVTFAMTGAGSEKRISVSASEVERVVTHEREPEFSNSLTVDPRPTATMMRGLLKAAGVRARMPEPLLEPVGLITGGASPGPDVPSLRTWEEVRRDQEAESVATLTGIWRLMQPEVTVPASRSRGSTWDEATEEDGPEPDLSLRIDNNGEIADLELAPNTLKHGWRWQTDATFRNNRPKLVVTVADIDGENREVIGYCELDLKELLRTAWHTCEEAKVKFDVEWVDPAPVDEFELTD